MSEHKEFMPLEHPPVLLTEISLETQSEEKVNREQVKKDIKTLGAIIELIVSTDSDIQKYNVEISPKVKSILEKLLNENNYFEKVEEYLLAIIKDNKLDAKDVPIVMLLLTELYERLESFSLEDVNSEDCADILKIIFEVALQEKIVPISDENIELVSSIFNIIDTSVRLIQTRNNLDDAVATVDSSKQGLCYCLTRYICKWIKVENNSEDE
jgi:hypothetical protein